jgi:hypothetical protein
LSLGKNYVPGPMIVDGNELILAVEEDKEEKRKR